MENTISNKQTKGLTRNTIDKYYTKPQIVQQCIHYLQQSMSIHNDDLFIEPSAGNGSFINEIKNITSNYIFYDLEPEHPEIIKQDYLLFDYLTNTQNNYNKIHVIGNPPFGRQSSLAIQFIKKSCEFCDSISFILPKSFKKESMKKSIPINYHLIVEYDIPDNSFLVDNKEHNVPCVFQIWEKKDFNRIIPPKLTPSNYSFVKKNEQSDFAFRRVGVNAGHISKDVLNKSEQSHYFIKFDEKISDELYSQLSTIQFDCKNNTVGPKSISKQEIIPQYNELLSFVTSK
jgi:predicted RNA methylase